MQSAFCPHCGFQGQAHLPRCERCAAPRPQQVSPPQPQVSPPQPQCYPGYPAQPGSQPPPHPAQPGLQPQPQGYPGYPAQPGSQPQPQGYPGYPAQPGLQPQPQGYPGYPAQPGSQPQPQGYPGYPAQPGSQPPQGYPGHPAQPGSPPQQQQPHPSPEREQLVYPNRVAMPHVCACCLEPATTTQETDQVQTSSQSVASFRFPYCAPCSWHITWSGRFKTGVVAGLGPLAAIGGLIGGILLAPRGEQADQAGRIVLGGVLALGGYLAVMLLVALLGLGIARSKPTCTARGAPVKIRRAAGGYQFRFSSVGFDRMFRSMNHGNRPLDVDAIARNLSRRR